MPTTPALSEPAANSPVTGAGHAHLLYLSSAMLAVHLGTNALGGYGFIRDELYYLACSDHLAWGYVDHPPLSIALLSLGRLLFGDSLGAVRVLPAISGALVVLLTCLLTGALGGGRSAQVLAALCVMAAPLALGMNAVFSMNSFDVLFWTAAFCLVVRLMTRDDRRDWVLLGLTLGVGLLNKISVLWLGAGLATGLLLTRHRRRLLTPGPWLAAVIALLVFSPHIRWQMNNAYPTLEFIRNAGFGKYAALSPLELFVEQSLLMNPVCLPIWIAGVAYFLGARRVSSFRILPIVYLTVFAILAINGNSKASYLVPLVPLLFSMGGVAIDAMLTRWRGVRAAAMAVVVASGIALAPLVLPVLPVRTYIAYADALGVAPFTSESHELGPLPQHFADMFGWPEMVATIARAYDTLRPEERARCAILLGNYGEAGAVDFFGGAYGLPRAISGHNNYWLWGPRGATGEVVIVLGGSERSLLAKYEHVTQAGLVQHPYAMPYESNLPVWICRNRRRPLSDDWPQLKVFN